MLATQSENLALIAAIAALGAWWVSWREARRNNRVILKPKSFTSAFTPNLPGASYTLQIDVVNRGITLQDISMSLCFHGPGKSGTVSIPIPLSQRSTSMSSTFLRGTTARFVLSPSHKETTNLSMLHEISVQRPIINLQNASFLARSFAIHSRCDPLKKLWNRFSLKLTIKYRVGEGCEGQGVFRFYRLPCFQIRSEKLHFFLNGLSQRNIRGSQTTSSAQRPRNHA